MCVCNVYTLCGLARMSEKNKSVGVWFYNNILCINIIKKGTLFYGGND